MQGIFEPGAKLRGWLANTFSFTPFASSRLYFQVSR